MCVLRLLLLVALTIAWTGPNAHAQIALGLVRSLVVDLNPGQKKLVDNEFPQLVQQFTGLRAQLVQGDDVETLVKKLTAGTLQFGIFSGLEFAWARKIEPKLKPVLASTYRQIPIRAYLVVDKQKNYRDFSSLKGVKVGWHKQGRLHNLAFLEKMCRDKAQSTPQAYFSDRVTPENGEAALDGLLTGEYQAVVVDEVALRLYRDLHDGGGRYLRLSALAQSELFPAGVVAYVEGKVPEATVTQFRQGMLQANNSEKGRDVMSMFLITAFEPIPAGFDAAVVKAQGDYPRNK